MAAARVARARSARARVARQAALLLNATANPEGRGLLVRGAEPRPRLRDAFDPDVLDGLLRLARLAASVADSLRDHPHSQVRRSAAVLAARAHPLRAGLDD